MDVVLILVIFVVSVVRMDRRTMLGWCARWRRVILLILLMRLD